MKRKKLQKTTVTVYQASDVELSRRNSRNSLEITVRKGEDLLGTLVMGQGSVEWWPNGNKTNALKKTWIQFAKLLETAMGG